MVPQEVIPLDQRKRLSKPETWKRNVAKAKRSKGEEYVSPSTGKTVPSRSMGEPCKCKRKCFERFTASERETVFKSLNKLANKELQDAHLFGLITANPVKRRRPRNAKSLKEPRKAQYTYSVSIWL